MEVKIKVVTPTMKVNDELFYKMQVEFEETMEDITELPSCEMFDKAHEVAMKQILLKCFEVRDIPYTAAKALLKLDRPLEYVYLNYIQTHCAYDDFYEFITTCGNNLNAAFDEE